MKKILISIKNIYSKMSLVDKFLIIIMFVLLLQSAYTLFVHEIISQDSNTIDTVTRTSAAAIFGYFISGNFIKANSTSTSQNTTNDVITVKSSDSKDSKVNKIKNQIGFNTDNTASDTGITNASVSENSSICCDKIQVIIVSMIGILSLIFLLALRNFVQITPQTSATVSQLRDFVSACVGFLISCGKK